MTRWLGPNRQNRPRPRKPSALGFGRDFLLVDGKKVLECIVIGCPESEELSLPGGNVYGTATAYSVLCSQFLSLVFEDEEGAAAISSKMDQDDMIRFYTKFATKDNASLQQVVTTTSKGKKTIQSVTRSLIATSNGFSASILYRGYIDDPSNTDNAWREAEVWNLHYDLTESFDEKIKDKNNVMWREIMPSLRLYGNQDSIVKEAARIHSAYI